jgi:EAL domain-containing protein (putative c-di-GMP-specific phosphodiesterase class I)
MATSTNLATGVRLQELTVALQPVLNLRTGKVHGFEALLRGPAGSDINPPALFRRARREHWLGELEDRARSLAFEAAERYLEGEEVLFLNGDVRFPMPPHSYPHVVMEVSEAQDVSHHQVENLRRQGMKLYLDDYGVSHGNLSRILDIRPCGIKVDRSIVRGISQDVRRFAIARALASLASDLGMELVAEGIETSEDLVASRRAGFTLGQGYYLGRPVLDPDRQEINRVSQLLSDLVIERVTSARFRLVASSL